VLVKVSVKISDDLLTLEFDRFRRCFNVINTKISRNR